ncbi:hypothetical protein B0H11DRAFT_2191245 [Mycena galericulata]|nr:hypothetical protein B0H11DRAFT_2191245 [Mycena galericulata]
MSMTCRSGPPESTGHAALDRPNKKGEFKNLGKRRPHHAKSRCAQASAMQPIGNGRCTLEILTKDLGTFSGVLARCEGHRTIPRFFQRNGQRSKAYVKADIQELGDMKYLVQSKSNPSKSYEVDIDTYTCNCLDFPLISYCKHICAVQELFDEPGASPAGPRPSPQIPREDSTPIQPLLASALAPKPSKKSHALTKVAEKLERLAARLRRPRKKESDLQALPDLEAALDAMLLETDSSNVLPVSQYLPPNKTYEWSTTREAMLPGVKMKKKAAGADRDLAYGAGASSGSKSKKAKVEKSRASSSKVPETPLLPPNNPSSSTSSYCALPPPPPLLPAQHPYPYFPPYSYTHTMPPAYPYPTYYYPTSNP